jgi:hypothetical protein
MCVEALPININARQPGVSFQTLQALEESVFTDGVKDRVSDEEAMFIVCRAIHARKDSLLPSLTHDIDHTIESLVSAISQHYKEIGFPLRGKSLQELKKGYFEATDAEGKAVSMTIDKGTDGEGKDKVVLNFEYADQGVTFENPLDVTTKATSSCGWALHLHRQYCARVPRCWCRYAKG